MTKYRFKSTIFVSLILFVFFSCKNGNKPETEKNETEVLSEDVVELRADQIKLADIETGLIEMHSLSGTLKVNGKVDVAPQNMATVCMPMGGFVKSTSLMPGETVRKGQTLAILENQEFIDIQENYLEAKSKLSYAKAEFERHSKLFKDDVYSQKNLEQVTVEYKSLKAQVNALRQKLSLIGINPNKLNEDNISRSVAVVSPISGYVKTVNVNVGKNVSSSDILFEIVNSNKLFLELTLFEKDADNVSVGQKIHFFINDETEQHDAVIYQTGKIINEDKTYKVYASVRSNCEHVLPGMYVTALIESSGKNVTAVPNDAVVSFNDRNYIFVYKKDKKEDGKAFTEYQMIEIRKGITYNGFTEINLPVNFKIQTTKVVTKGAYNLLSAKKNAGEMAC
jgi:RND family efflux transporter MFP subunit